MKSPDKFSIVSTTLYSSVSMNILSNPDLYPVILEIDSKRKFYNSPMNTKKMKMILLKISSCTCMILLFYDGKHIQTNMQSNPRDSSLKLAKNSFAFDGCWVYL